MKKKFIFALIRNHKNFNRFEIFLSRQFDFPLDKNGNELNTPIFNYSVKYAIQIFLCLTEIFASGKVECKWKYSS